ncbi:MAG TPA: VOC family protein [Caulobacteraceae bacterium]|nr:VOC family protein [Caulobacteraceae bacterium]
MEKITTCLWFNDEAEEAARFYVSLFPGSKILQVSQRTEDTPGPKGKALMVVFSLNGTEIQALNGGAAYKLSPAVSLSVSCETQGEVDRLWEKLGEGGRYIQCGWLTDRFGLSWQIVPRRLGELLSDPDKGRAGRAMQAMLKMVKLDVAELERAAAAA